MAALPYATDEQAARAIAHVSCVLLAAKNGNQHNENMVVLMDQATAMFQRIAVLESALQQIADTANHGVNSPSEALAWAGSIAAEALSTPPPQID